MTPLAKALGAAMEALSPTGVPFALIGGLAVSVRTEPRFTRDVDLALAVPDDPTAEEVVFGLVKQGWRVLSHLEQDATSRLATTRMMVSDQGSSSGVVIDLLFASSGIEAEIVACAESIEVFEGVTAPVASAAHLLAMKVLAMDEESRPQDRADAVALLAVLDSEGIEEVRGALELIAQRGYHRGRDLQARLADLLS